jgi:hypothetical protein
MTWKRPPWNVSGHRRKQEENQYPEQAGNSYNRTRVSPGPRTMPGATIRNCKRMHDRV